MSYEKIDDEVKGVYYIIEDGIRIGTFKKKSKRDLAFDKLHKTENY